jgi:hypothetical protein
MKLNTLIVAAAMFPLLAGLSQSNAWSVEPARPAVAIGKVQGLYVRAAEGVYREWRPSDAGVPVWADLRFNEQEVAGGAKAVALVGQDMQLARGDLVEMRFADRGRMARAVAPAPQVNRVMLLAARAGSLAANEYDRPAIASGWMTAGVR